MYRATVLRCYHSVLTTLSSQAGGSSPGLLRYGLRVLATGSFDRPVARVVPLDGATDAGAETSTALSAADHRVADHFPIWGGGYVMLFMSPCAGVPLVSP